MGTLIRHIAVWLSRIAYCRGFGIQSPSAYAFVRYVINEHYPYYAYRQLDSAAPSLSRADRKRMRLCLRVANQLQPQYIVDQQDGLSRRSGSPGTEGIAADTGVGHGHRRCHDRPAVCLGRQPHDAHRRPHSP